jgi:hypothetical protein
MNLDVVDMRQHVYLMVVLSYKELNGVKMKNNIGRIQMLEKEEIQMDINITTIHL